MSLMFSDIFLGHKTFKSWKYQVETLQNYIDVIGVDASLGRFWSCRIHPT